MRDEHKITPGQRYADEPDHSIRIHTFGHLRQKTYPKIRLDLKLYIKKHSVVTIHSQIQTHRNTLTVSLIHRDKYRLRNPQTNIHTKVIREY